MCIYICIYIYTHTHIHVSTEVGEFSCLLRFAHSAFAAGATAQVAQGMLEGCCTQGRASGNLGFEIPFGGFIQQTLRILTSKHGFHQESVGIRPPKS